MKTKSRQKNEKMHGHLLPCCDMCKKTPASGLRGGIKIEKIFLCKECEWKIVAAESNRPDYDNLLKKVKKLWRINLMRQARRRNFIGKD